MLAGPALANPAVRILALVAREGCGDSWELMTIATGEAGEGIKRFAAGSTSRQWCHRKSTPKIGKLNDVIK